MLLLLIRWGVITNDKCYQFARKYRVIYGIKQRPSPTNLFAWGNALHFSKRHFCKVCSYLSLFLNSYDIGFIIYGSNFNNLMLTISKNDSLFISSEIYFKQDIQSRLLEEFGTSRCTNYRQYIITLHNKLE